MTARMRSDDGVTLLEVVVAMSIMAVFMAIFTAGALQVHRTTNRTQSTIEAQSQLNVVMQRLDKEIRYASAISTPAKVGGDYYVEYTIVNAGPTRCYQLRLDPESRDLRQRDWIRTTATPPKWTVSPVVLAGANSATNPFTLSAVEDTVDHQRLRVLLSTTSGGGDTARTKQVDVTFTAVNSAVKATTNADVCTEGRSYP